MGLNIADLTITSSAFDNLAPLDQRFTQYGDNLQPALAITGVPEGAVELAIVCHDPDAPRPWGFTHWTLYGIPADTTEIGEQQGDQAFRPGPTDKGASSGYVGPRPPAGHGRHHYYFWVYALGQPMDGTPSRREFLDTYADVIIEQNRVVGTYQQD